MQNLEISSIKLSSQLFYSIYNLTALETETQHILPHSSLQS